MCARERRGAPVNRLNLRHILCPIDFSPLSGISLAAASAIARTRRAELRALHVVPSEGVRAPERLGALGHRTLMSRLRERLAGAAPDYDHIGAAVRQGDPATQILRFARAMPADLIVMGAPGIDRPERPIGPVASVVVARSECPVVTVPAHQPAAADDTGVFRRIVCAADLTPSSVGVISQALSLGWETHGHVTFVCVVAGTVSRSSSEIRRRLLAAIPSDAHEWCEIEVVATRGEASAEIVRIADRMKSDLVVIGPPRRWVSTTHAVLSQSLCPVLVTHDARPLPPPKTARTRTGIHTAA
jgi:nucleotide-binding universal stress UspA family protein